jgi:Zn-dependent protease
MWTLATGIFPDTNPGLGDNAYFAMAVVASLAFFASILLHELGHAIQARRDGMEIDGITLWIFGGIARFTGMFPSAGAEFRIAVAGPLVSLCRRGVLGVALVPGIPVHVDGVLVARDHQPRAAAVQPHPGLPSTAAAVAAAGRHGRPAPRHAILPPPAILAMGLIGPGS